MSREFSKEHMNTYKIKARASARTDSVKLLFTVDAEDLTKAQDEAGKKLAREGHKYSRIESITELGPSNEAPAKTHRPKKSVIVFACGGVECDARLPQEGYCTNCMLKLNPPTISGRAPREKSTVDNSAPRTHAVGCWRDDSHMGACWA